MKIVIFLYIHDEFSEREIKKTVPLTTALKKIKCLGINLSKEMETLGNNHKEMLEIKNTGKELKNNFDVFINKLYMAKERISESEVLNKNFPN